MNLLHLVSLPHCITSRPKDCSLIFFGLQITYLVNVSQCNGVEPVTEAIKARRQIFDCGVCKKFYQNTVQI